MPGLTSLDLAGSTSLLLLFAPIAALVYGLALLDARNPRSAASVDPQIGLKALVSTLALAGVLLVATGLTRVLHYILTLSEVEHMKAGLPAVVSGGAALGLVHFLLPRTNWQRFPKIARLTVGIIALASAVAAIGALHGALHAMFMRQGWTDIAGHVAALLTTAPLAYLAVTVLGQWSAWNRLGVVLEGTTPGVPNPMGPGNTTSYPTARPTTVPPGGVAAPHTTNPPSPPA